MPNPIMPDIKFAQTSLEGVEVSRVTRVIPDPLSGGQGTTSPPGAPMLLYRENAEATTDEEGTAQEDGEEVSYMGESGSAIFPVGGPNICKWGYGWIPNSECQKESTCTRWAGF